MCTYSYTVARVRDRSSRVPICQESTERAAPSAEMGKKFSKSGAAMRYGSDALAVYAVMGYKLLRGVCFLIKGKIERMHEQLWYSFQWILMVL